MGRHVGGGGKERDSDGNGGKDNIDPGRSTPAESDLADYLHRAPNDLLHPLAQPFDRLKSPWQNTITPLPPAREHPYRTSPKVERTALRALQACQYTRTMRARMIELDIQRICRLERLRREDAGDGLEGRRWLLG
jgi:hypothetical protein